MALKEKSHVLITNITQGCASLQYKDMGMRMYKCEHESMQR